MSRAPAFARDVVAKRQAGDRIGLLVVSVHDWRAGKWFDGRPEVARVVVGPDADPAKVRFECARALDVLICGAADGEAFYAAADALLAYGAASIWADFEDGISRIERLSSGWVAEEGPYPLQWLSRAIQAHRVRCLLGRTGIYADERFDAARQLLLSEFEGVPAEPLEVAA